MVPLRIVGAALDTAVLGSGDPVVLVPTALTADELLPLAQRLQGRFRVIHYHRRGYGGSSPAMSPGSVARDSADCAALLAALGVHRAHVVGASYSAAVALQLAIDHPDVVHTLTLVEPPPVHGPGDGPFRAAAAALLGDRRARGARAAAERFLASTAGPGWRGRLDEEVPGSSARALRDSRTFFDVDVPALLVWPFDATGAAGVHCPVLHVAGSDHGALFGGIDRQIRARFPQAAQVVVRGAGHDVALPHAGPLSQVMGTFSTEHPVG